MITAQYYINQIMDEAKGEGRNIYPIILTHIDPQYFKTYCFNPKSICYLEGKAKGADKYNFHKVLKKRGAFPSLATYFLHYHPTSHVDVSMKTHGVKSGIELNTTFYDYSRIELERYVAGKKFDVAMVCSGLRVHMESKVYGLLAPHDKSEFISTHGTSDKFDFATEVGVKIPEIYYMLGIIYNECLHLDQHGKKIIAVEHKLMNFAVKKMVSDVSKNIIEPFI